MSLNKSATRRLSLLAGSSLVAAALATTAFTGAALAPTAVWAANECAPVDVDPAANGTAADTRTCTGATTYQTSGITYTTEGNLTVTSTGAMDVGAVGINLIGEAADTVAFTSNGMLTGASGAVVDITSASGNITATTAGVTATAVGATNAVRLQSTGGGNITFTKTGTNAAAIINSTAAGADAAVTAITNGGNITLTIASGNPTFTTDPVGTGINGYQRGILAQTSGAGSVVLNVTGLSGVMANLDDGLAAVDISAGTGGVDINLTTGNVGGRPVSLGGVRVPYSDPLAMRIVSSGAVTIDNTGGRVVGAVDFSGVTAAGGVRFENLGTGGSGGGDFSTGGTWHASGDSIFSGQNDVLLMGGTRAHKTAAGATIDFGGGTDTFNMSGVLLISGMSISNLEAFNNSGTIFLGPSTPAFGTDPLKTDDRADDVLSIHGVTFTGSGASLLNLDVVLDGTAQVGCETLTGAADCFDLRDSSTAGSTAVRINDASPAALLSGYVPAGITLVDVSGSGSSAAAHFTLDPASTSYVSPLYGAALDRPGAFVYIFRYDAANQRHILVSQPKSRDLFDYAIIPGAAHSIWHLTADTVTDRQTDLRDGAEGGSVWLRTAGEVTRRDVETSFAGWDGVQNFDNSYNLYAGTITGGIDLLSGSTAGFDYVLGAQIGYVSSSLDMDESESSGRFTGATGGAYGSLWSDGVFLDAALNLNGLALDFQHPSLGSKTTTFVNSVGGKAEGGARAPIGENTFVEPLLAVAWVRSTFEEISLAAGEIQPGDAESLRGAVGLRFGGTLPGQTVSATYFVTGRAWNEFEGEGATLMHNPGADLGFTDEFSGLFGQAEAGINVFNASNTLSGFLTGGVKFKDGYSAVDLSLGVRMAW